MVRKLEQYRFRDGQTPLSEKELNARVFDIDSRIHALELLSISWKEAVATVQNEGIRRINELIVPILKAGRAELEDISRTFDTWRTGMEQSVSAFTTEQAGIVQAKITEMENRIHTIEETFSQMQGTWGTILSGWTAIQQGWAGMGAALDGKAPASHQHAGSDITSAVGNASKLGGYSPSLTGGVNVVPVSGADGKIAGSFLPEIGTSWGAM